MRILFLDLGSHNGSIACVDEESVKHLTSIDRRIDDSMLVGLIEQTLKEAGWPYKGLTHLACVVGPGGFTSLRVGVAAGNALASSLNIPSCGVHLSEVYMARAGGRWQVASGNNAQLPHATGHEPQAKTLWLHSTKKHKLFIRGPDFPEPVCITVDDLKGYLKKGITWMGELIPEQQEIVTKAGLTAATLCPSEDILPHFLAGQDYKEQILQPWYGRGW